MTDVNVQGQTIKIEKNLGITHALKKMVEKMPNSVISDGKITKAEWDKTMDKLIEINEKRKSEGKESIFTGGNQKSNWHKNFVVQPKDEITFTDNEMSEILGAMGVSITAATTPVEQTPVAPTPTDSTGVQTPVAPTPTDSTGVQTPVVQTPTDSTGVQTPVAPTPTDSTGVQTPADTTAVTPAPVTQTPEPKGVDKNKETAEAKKTGRYELSWGEIGKIALDRTKNFVKGFFCDKDGFSVARTATTLAGVAAFTFAAPAAAAIFGAGSTVAAATALTTKAVGVGLTAYLGVDGTKKIAEGSKAYYNSTTRDDAVKNMEHAWDGGAEVGSIAALWGLSKVSKAFGGKKAQPTPEPTQPQLTYEPQVKGLLEYTPEPVKPPVNPPTPPVNPPAPTPTPVSQGLLTYEPQVQGILPRFTPSNPRHLPVEVHRSVTNSDNLPVLAGNKGSVANPDNLPVLAGHKGSVTNPDNLPVLAGHKGSVTNPDNLPIVSQVTPFVQEHLPVLAQATSGTAAKPTVVRVGAPKAKQIGMEVKTAVENPQATPTDLAVIQRGVDGIQNRTLRRQATQQIQQKVETLPADKQLAFQQQVSTNKAQQVKHIFEKHSELNATDVKLIKEQIATTTDVKKLAELKADLHTKEYTYGGKTADYKALETAIDAKTKALTPKPQLTVAQNEAQIYSKLNSGKGLVKEDVIQIQEYVQNLSSNQDLVKLQQALNGKKMTTAHKKQLKTAIANRQAELQTKVA